MGWGFCCCPHGGLSLSAAFLGNATSCPKAGLSLSGTEPAGSPPSWGSARRAGRSTAHLGILLGDEIHEAKAPVGSRSCRFLGQPHSLELSKGAVNARKSRDSMRGREGSPLSHKPGQCQLQSHALTSGAVPCSHSASCKPHFQLKIQLGFQGLFWI